MIGGVAPWGRVPCYSGSMTKAEITEAALSLPRDKQLELAPELRDLLRERLAQAKADPHGSLPWEEVHRKIERSLEDRHASMR